MNKTRVAVYLALIFVAGGIAGGAVAWNFSPKFGHPPGGAPHHTPEQFRQHLFDMLKKRLALTPDQVQKIEPVFNAGFAEVRSIQDKSVAEVDRCVKLNHEEIAKLLTPEQKAELEKMDREREEAFRKHEGPHGPPPPPDFPVLKPLLNGVKGQPAPPQPSSPPTREPGNGSKRSDARTTTSRSPLIPAPPTTRQRS